MADEIERIQKTTTVELLKCPHCGHMWEPRKEQPRQCPSCRTRLGKFWAKESK